jgi:ABC-type Mn2+/Zn2+ transport system ATPase subunit
MTSSLLELKELRIGYPGRALSSPITLEIPEKVRLGIIGGNGSGKTTFLKTILGLIPSLGGSFQWKTGSTFGYVPQEHQLDSLFPIMVKDLLKMGAVERLPRLGRSSADFEKRAATVSELLEIRGLYYRLFRELSGGQRQRALIARALITRPQVLIMDEPHNSLDYSFREKLWRLLAAYQSENSFSWMIIDHDLNRIVNQVNWICLMGPEKIACGPASEVLKPEILSEAYGEPVHIHQEDDRFQVHFL